MESFPCPGCAEPMPVGTEVCPACRRPRSEEEVDAARAARAAFAERRRSLRLRLVALAALAAAGAGAFLQRDALRSLARGAGAGLAADYERIANPAGAKPLSPEAVVAAMEASRRETAETPAPPAADAPAAPAPAAPAPADPGPVQPFDDPGLPNPHAVRVYGIVYDLDTLRPVHPARLIFSMGERAVAECGTDSRGRYQLDFAPEQLEEGLSVAVTSPGYRDGQLEESGQPYRLRETASRQGTAEETVDSDLAPLRVGRPDSRGLVALDLVLLPAKPKKD